MKPFETGDGEDAEKLKAAARDPRSLSLIRPHRLQLPAAPMVAAEAEGVSLGLEVVQAAFATMADFDVALVEGAGGLLVPINAHTSMATVAGALNLPLLIVARPSLGTINHTLLTIEVARQRGLVVAGVVFSHSLAGSGREEARTPSLIGELGKVKIWGSLRHLDAATTADAASDLAHLVEALFADAEPLKDRVEDLVVDGLSGDRS